MSVKKITSIKRIYAFSFLSTAAIFLAVGYWGGVTALLTVMVLAAFEITFSFDNAIVNAKVLSRMSPFWQGMFMTVGIVIAVFGVRFVLPIILVAITSGLGMGDVVNLALHDPDTYAHYLTLAHPAIAAFGGMFLLTIFGEFIVDYGRRIQWLRVFELPFMKIGRLRQFPPLMALVTLVLVTELLGGDQKLTVLLSGVVGLITFLAIRGSAELVELKERQLASSGKSAFIKTGFISFLYLELLDASFSFDSVLGAFAITSMILFIAIGLGVGAIWVRSMTLHIVRQDVLLKYRYLDHGAHYAIGALAVLLLLGIRYNIDQFATGLIGLCILAVSFYSSWRYNRRHEPKLAVTRSR